MSRTQPGAPARITRHGNALWIWLVPVIALLITLSLWLQARGSEGPEIVIAFRNAAGLEAGKTVVKYKDVTVGTVSAITLSPEGKQVLVQVRLSRSAASLARADSRFWVVRPRVSIGGISGIDTLLSGAYLSADQGNAHEIIHEFIGLELPPAVINDMPGRAFTLAASDLGSLDIGSPVYYRRIQVGRLAAYRLAEEGHRVDVQLFIDAPYDGLVKPNTRFWNVSGVDVSVGANGFRLKTESVATVMLGGIAFATPEENTLPLQDHYTLAEDQATAMSPPDGPAIPFRLRFARSLHGLSVGAPVEFSSVTIGRVTAIGLDYEPQAYRFPTEVTIEVYPSRMGHVLEKIPTQSGNPSVATANFTRELVARGLRARALPSNLLTGQLYISIDVVPDAPKVTFDMHSTPLQLPTLDGGLDKIQEQVASIVNKINKMPLNSLSGNLNVVLTELGKTLHTVNAQTLPEASRLMKQTQLLSTTTQHLLAEDSPLMMQLTLTLQQTIRSLRAVSDFTEQLERHPESLLRGRPKDTPPQQGNRP